MTVKIKKTFIFLILIFCIILTLLCFSQNYVRADNLSESIDEQLGNIDLTELEEFFNNTVKFDGLNFSTCISQLLNGQYDLNFSSFFNYIADIVLSNVFDLMPVFLGVIIIALLCGIVQNVRGTYLNDSVAEMTFFACIMAIILILSTQIISMYKNIEITIKNIGNLSEIMSPIIITLMLAVGGNTSASIYKPVVAFLSNGIIEVVISVVLPLVILITLFNIASNFSVNIKLNKFIDFFTGIIKWIIGIIVTVFSLFLTVQGITGAHFDGISIKAAKYAISNSIPIVGGFIKDGFDLVIAGSVLIKNAIGITVVFALLAMIISPVLNLAVFSLLLKLTAAITEPISDVRISNFCTAINKTISYFIAALLIVGLMTFITVLLMIFSANAFI